MRACWNPKNIILAAQQQAPAAVDGVDAADDGRDARAVQGPAAGVCEKVLVRGRGGAPRNKLVHAAGGAPVAHK